MEYSEFLKQVKKVSSSRTFKITNSFSIKGAYKWYRHHRPKKSKYVLLEGQFYAIIRTINDMLADALVRGEEVKFPARMGLLEIRKYHIEPYINKDGEFVYKAPIDWGKTLRFWYENPEAYKNKITIKVEKHDNYKIEYNKSKACFKKKSYYMFQPNRALRIKVHQAAKEGKLDAFEYKYRPDGSRKIR
jgi:hypothetical protein